MKVSSPYHLFSPIHLAWLYRQHDKRLDVTKADLDFVEANDVEAAADPLFAEYRARADAGTLRRKPGRKPWSISRLLLVDFLIQDEMTKIWADRRAGRRKRFRTDLSPVHEAAEYAARFLRLGSGQSLLNRISLERKKRKLLS